MTAVPVLSVERLAVSFHQYERGLRRRTVTPVSDMTMSAGAGEVVAVVGGSGAGKSLVGLAVMGLLPRNAEQSGTIRFRGEELTAARRLRLAGRELAFLPQSASFLDPFVPVGAQVRRAARLAGLRHPAEAAAAALERRGLAEAGRRHPHELSGGMARRVLFAIATIARPAAVFADEPTPGLDPAAAAAVLSDLRRVADEGAAVLLVTHDIDRALTIADRVVVCEAGRTIEEARPAQFAGDGRTLREPYSRALWQALPAHGFTEPAPVVAGAA